MRRVVLILAAAAMAATTAACGGGEVTVAAQLEGASTGTEAAESVALGNLAVRLLPYDRDALFDSLAQAYPEPEPQVPDSIVALQNRVEEAYAQWQQAEDRWAVVRDSLQTLSEQMNRLDAGSGEYTVMYQDFLALEGEVDDLEQQSQQQFQDFSQLQTRLGEVSREIELQRRTWSDEAFAPVDSIIEARLEARGLEELADTTTAQGVAFFSSVDPGQWWVYSRYERAYDELYWNVPIEVARGEEVTVQLTEENAEVRTQM